MSKKRKFLAGILSSVFVVTLLLGFTKDLDAQNITFPDGGTASFLLAADSNHTMAYTAAGDGDNCQVRATILHINDVHKPTYVVEEKSGTQYAGFIVYKDDICNVESWHKVVHGTYSEEGTNFDFVREVNI